MAQSLSLRVFDDADSLARAAAESIADLLHDAVRTRGEAHWLLAGGTTPVRTYGHIARSALKGTVDWGRVHFWWGDERWVRAGNPLSNQGMAHDALLTHLPVATGHIHAFDVAAPSPEAATAAYEGELRRVFQIRPLFDVALLGVGEDGHVASLFPGSRCLDEARWVVVERRAPKQPETRVSLGVTTLAAARCHVVLAQGRAKAEVLRRVLQGGEDLPITRVLAGGRDIRWFVDTAAWPLAPAGVAPDPVPLREA